MRKSGKKVGGIREKAIMFRNKHFLDILFHLQDEEVASDHLTLPTCGTGYGKVLKIKWLFLMPT